jgi:hypothetical protein
VRTWKQACVFWWPWRLNEWWWGRPTKRRGEAGTPRRTTRQRRVAGRLLLRCPGNVRHGRRWTLSVPQRRVERSALHAAALRTDTTRGNRRIRSSPSSHPRRLPLASRRSEYAGSGCACPR